MTTSFLFFYSAWKAVFGPVSGAPVSNPLPVIQGPIGQQKAKSASKASQPTSGFLPLDPTKLAGVILTRPGQNTPVPMPSASAASTAKPKPKTGAQGANETFIAAIAKLFADPKPEPKPVAGPAETKTAEPAKTPPPAPAPVPAEAAKAPEKAKEPAVSPSQPTPKPAPQTAETSNTNLEVSAPKQVPSPAGTAGVRPSIPTPTAGQPETPAASPVRPTTGGPTGVRVAKAATKTALAPLKKEDVAPARKAVLPPALRPAPSPVANNVKPATPAPIPPASVALTDPGLKAVSIDVVDMELSKVLQSLSEQSSTNLVLMSGGQKTLTIRLNRLPLEEALAHICAVSGLKQVRVNRTFIIAEADQLEKSYPREFALAYPKPEAPVAAEAAAPVLSTEVINLSYTTAREIVNILKQSFSEKELKVQVGPSQHIPGLATADTQEVTGVATGILKDENQGGGGGGQEENSSPTSRVVVLRGTKDVVESAKKIAKQLDKARPQVSIAVRIIDISNEAMRDLGLSWTFGDTTIQEDTGTGINFRSFSRDPQSFLAKITALQKADRAKIMAEPNVSVLDNQKAFILIGQRLNFPTLIGYTQANTPIFAPKEERVGIYMQVSASVAPSGDITMSLYPQVSTVTGFLEVNGASYPQISTREAQTTLRVKSGESIVLGGLIKEEEIKNVQKVPFLADIPILGEFFKKTKNQKSASQIIITITPIVTFPSENAS